MNKYLLYVLPLGLMLLSINAHAELYKWTDDKGAVHYSDAKPNTATVSNSQIKLNQAVDTSSGSEGIRQVITKKPLKNVIGKSVKSVQLEKVLIELSDSTSNRKVIGTVYFGQNCLTKSLDLVVTAQTNQINNVNTEKKMQEIFSANNYKFVGKREAIFAGQQAESADLSVAAIITDIKMRVCQKGNNRLKPEANVEVYLKVEWQLFDPLDRRVIYKGQTQGYERNDYDDIDNSAGRSAMNTALANAMLNLLAENNFVQNLQKTDDLPKINTDNAQHLKVISHSILKKSRFVDDAESLQNSVVTVRTTTGHGTGFYVSKDGYILTNAHVVNDAQTVLIITKERQFKADVIRKDQQRDIALLKPREPVNVAALSLSARPTKVGETIYVIGTPLDEKLEHTITSGIVSASRKNEDGLTYYQTDAALNAGNSGGPAFNNTGEVMGIAVSGLFSKGGTGLNINFLIPIDDAISKLNIGFQ